MVHALREAHRVMKPEGLLIDLRPAAVHRRVGFKEAKGYRLRWVMRENFVDDYAADRAVAEVIARGWFKAGRRRRFPCYRLMDTADEFQAWLDDFVNKGKFASHEWLVQRVRHELETTAGRKKKIVVSGPLVMRELRKSGELTR
jgi:hypothetical protein